jgi:hypothetical protein
LPIDTPKKPKKGKIDTGKITQDNLFSKWWLRPESDIYRSVNSIVDRLSNVQSVRYSNNLRFARLYQNVDILAYATGFYGRQSTTSLPQNRVTYNVVKSCVDSAAAKIAKNRPKIQFLTEEGDFKLQRKAENLTQYVSGLFEKTSAYNIGQRIFVDACVWGTGCMHVYVTDDDNIGLERVFIQEITIDDMEGIYGNPRTMYRTKLISRDELKEMFPKNSKEIDQATTRPQSSSGDTLTTDQIKVREAWHLKSGPSAKDGKRVICIENCTLLEEEYERDSFPFVFFHWSDKLIGFWGQSLAEELVGIQLEINKLLRSITVAQDRMAVPLVCLENGSGISDDHMTVNQIAKIIRYTGTPPVFMTPSAIAPEIYQHLENLYKKAYEITGISQLSAMSAKPEGLDSGVALREYQDIETERFILCGQRYEQLYIDLSKLMIEISRDLYEEDKGLSVKVRGYKFIKNIDWKDVSLDDDQYSMQPFPISMLPSTPAGKLATVQNLVQAGFIPQSYAVRLLEFPDLEQFTSLSTAALETTQMLIEQMLEDGKYTPPDPYLDLDLAMTVTHTTYLRSLNKKGIPAENLDLLRTFMTDIQTLQGVGAPSAPQPAGGLTGAPQATGAPAPVSQLMPQMAPRQPQ